MANEGRSLNAVQQYWTDAWQRSVLVLDTLRERAGSQVPYESPDESHAS